MYPNAPVTKLPEYWVWHAMRQRCENRKFKQFADYGGRGISVCDRWRYGEHGHTGFECFYFDLGPRTTPKHTLERKQVNNGYCPENCCWITRAEQVRNCRTSFKATIDGETKIIKDFAVEQSRNLMTVRYRILVKGMQPKEALSAPTGSVLALPKSGFRGVYHHPNRKRQWQVRIKINGSFKSFGYYSTKQEAAQAWKHHTDLIASAGL
jgi:hypothetical protein